MEPATIAQAVPDLSGSWQGYALRHANSVLVHAEAVQEFYKELLWRTSAREPCQMHRPPSEAPRCRCDRMLTFCRYRRLLVGCKMGFPDSERAASRRGFFRSRPLSVWHRLSLQDEDLDNFMPADPQVHKKCRSIKAAAELPWCATLVVIRCATLVFF